MANAIAVIQPKPTSEKLVAPIGLPEALSMCLLALYARPHMIPPKEGSFNSCPGVLTMLGLYQTSTDLDSPAGMSGRYAMCTNE